MMTLLRELYERAFVGVDTRESIRRDNIRNVMAVSNGWHPAGTLGDSDLRALRSHKIREDA